MHEKMFHSIEDSAEITVTIKLITSCNAEHKVKQLNKETSDKIVIEQQTSCNAEHKEKQVNKETSDTIVIDNPNPNTQCSKKFWKITLTSTLHDKLAARQSVVAGGRVIGEAAYAAVGIFPYSGGPKGFESKNVGIVHINETFTLDRCCGIIGRANGFGMYDRFCTKKGCSVKAHLKSKFIPERSLFFAPGANDSAFCCHFVSGLNGQRNRNRMTSQKWIEAMEQMTSRVYVLDSTEPRLVAHTSNPRFYRLNCHTTDWKAIISSIILFLKKEKLHVDKRDVKHTLIVTKDRWETQEISKMLVWLKLCFYHDSSMCLRDFVTVCSYHDLSRKLSDSKYYYNAIIISDVSTLWTTIKKDVHLGFKDNYNLLCLLLKSPGIDVLEELFV